MGSTATLHHSLPQGAALPRHVAIIMDGNGRWAAERKISTARGHSQGGEAFRNLIEACKDRPFITHLTFYAFSIENWNRSADEVTDLMNLLRHYVKREALSLHKNGVCLRFIGERESLAQDIQRDLAELLRKLRGEGMGILLVEHDMDFVMGLVDHITVMEFGTKLIEGTPQEVQDSPAVRAAYLGTEH